MEITWYAGHTGRLNQTQAPYFDVRPRADVVIGVASVAALRAGEYVVKGGPVQELSPQAIERIARAIEARFGRNATA